MKELDQKNVFLSITVFYIDHRYFKDHELSLRSCGVQIPSY